MINVFVRKKKGEIMDSFFTLSSSTLGFVYLLFFLPLRLNWRQFLKTLQFSWSRYLKWHTHLISPEKIRVFLGLYLFILPFILTHSCARRLEAANDCLSHWGPSLKASSALWWIPLASKWVTNTLSWWRISKTDSLN